MTLTGTFAPLGRVGAGFAELAREALGHGAVRLRAWYRVMVTRRDLADMEDRMLADLGISRAQADFELSRSPWLAAQGRRR